MYFFLLANDARVDNGAVVRGVVVVASGVASTGVLELVPYLDTNFCMAGVRVREDMSDDRLLAAAMEDDDIGCFGGVFCFIAVVLSACGCCFFGGGAATILADDAPSLNSDRPTTLFGED